MQNVAPADQSPKVRKGIVGRLIEQLPRGNMLDDASWHRRHRLLQWVLLGHIPAMLLLGLWLGNSLLVIGYTLIGPAMGLVLGRVFTERRVSSFFVTGGLVFCSAGLVILTSGRIEAHFHFFIIIGFIALYQDWVPFLWNVAFTVVSHGVGSIWFAKLIFDHAAGQSNPWLWSAIHGIAVLAACIGMVIFWRITEDEQNARAALSVRLVSADAEIGRQQFTSDMLVNLARRNQSMLHRQLAIINQLEEKEQDPDALSELFKLDHLATRVRRNAENLLVLAGEQTPRTWSAPVLLRDVVRAAIAETEDLDRVVFAVGDHIAVTGLPVADLTHLLAELTENAVRFSPPDTVVTIRARPDRRNEGGHLLTVEDWGVGMPPDDLAAANEQLSRPRAVDLAVAKRLGFHVVSRLAARHGISVTLGSTPGAGVTAVVVLPPALFAGSADGLPPVATTVMDARPAPRPGLADAEQSGWIEPVSTTGARPGRNRAGVLDEPVHAPPAPRPAVPSEVWTVAQPEPEPLPMIPSGNWSGWWNPDPAVAGSADERRPVASAGPPADPPPAVAGGNGNSGNGNSGNGNSGNGHAANGLAGNGHAGTRHAGTGYRGTGHGGAGAGRHGGTGNGGIGNGATVSGGMGNGRAPVPHPRQPDGPGARPGLRRRVPQAHLAPELRQPTDTEGPDTPAHGAQDAASALSRYQASRQAALAESDGRGGTS